MTTIRNMCGKALASLLWLLLIAGALFMLLTGSISWDYQTGANVGTLTAVDKTFWGPYKVYVNDGQYIRTENGGHTGFTYCINPNDTELVDKAMSLIGKRVRVNYPEPLHFGIHWLNECHQAPVKSIEEVQ